jgi:O-antigen/teichoic acid export membrane protein
VSRALHLVVSGVARYAGQLAVFALVAVVLGPDQAGHYALALAVTAPVFVVAGLGLRPVFLTISPRVAAHDAETLRAAASVLALGATIVVAAAVADAPTALLVSVVAGSKAVDTFAELWSAFLQATGRHRRLSGSTVVATAAQVAAVAAALAGGAGVSGAVAAGAAVRPSTY